MSSEETILEQALAFSVPADRAEFLGRACGKDATLRSRIEILLGAHERAGGFLSEAVTRIGAEPRGGDEISESPGSSIGHYKILEMIGEGGFGIVYMAEQRAPVIRRVALKVIKLGMDTREVIARFEAERQALALMDHPNIAKVFDGGATDNGRPYFVMELVRGIPITQFCDEKALSTRQRLELFADVCFAIQHAHQKGVIHRDIKPSNILVAMNGDKPMPKVIDFGIAKAIEHRLTEKTLFTHHHEFIGTPTYMSPEQSDVCAVDIDTRSDIYSLGVLLYELITGKTPFEFKTLVSHGLDEMRRLIQKQDPPRPSARIEALTKQEATTIARSRKAEPASLRVLIHGELDWLVMKALEKDRTRRYASATAMAEDVQRYLANQPITAVAPSHTYRFRKFAQRHRASLIAAALFVALLVTGTWVSLWQAHRATHHAARATEQEALAIRSARDALRSAAEAEMQFYFSQMNLAQADWDASNMGRLEQSIESTQSNIHRGFEWFYWKRLTHMESLTFRAHAGEVRCVDFSPDGHLLVTAGTDRTARIWDLSFGSDRTVPARILDGHTDFVLSAHFSPDSSRIVTGGRDGLAHIWNAATGKRLLTLRGHTANVFSACFSPDGRRCLTSSADTTARIWDAASGQELHVLRGHRATVWSAAYAPDGTRIATAGVGQRDQVRLWNTQDMTQIATLTGHSRGVWKVGFSPDSRRLLTTSDDGTAKLWNVANGSVIGELDGGHSGPILTADFSRDGSYIITGSQDQTVKLWNAQTGTNLSRFRGHTHSVMSVAFAPGGRHFATGSMDGSVKLWPVLIEPHPLTIQTERSGILSARFSPQGDRFLTAVDGRGMNLWDAASGNRLHAFSSPSSMPRVGAFSPDGARILTGGDGAQAIIWNAVNGHLLNVLTNRMVAPEFRIWSLAFSPDGKSVAAGGGPFVTTNAAWGGATVWDSATGRERLFLGGHDDFVRAVAFSPLHNRKILTGGGTLVKIWDAQTGSELQVLGGQPGVVWDAVFSPDGNRVVTANFADNTANVWDVRTGQRLLTLRGHAAFVVSATFSLRGDRILTASHDRTAKVWETQTGCELLTLKGHTDWGWSAQFSPDGKQVITASQDGTVKIWKSASQD